MRKGNFTDSKSSLNSQSSASHTSANENAPKTSPPAIGDKTRKKMATLSIFNRNWGIEQRQNGRLAEMDNHTNGQFWNLATWTKHVKERFPILSSLYTLFRQAARLQNFKSPSIHQYNHTKLHSVTALVIWKVHDFMIWKDIPRLEWVWQGNCSPHFLYYFPWNCWNVFLITNFKW